MGTEAGSSSATEGVVNSQMQTGVRKESTHVTFFFHTNLYISKYLFAWVVFRVGCCSCASHGILLYVNKCHTLVLQFYFSLIVKLLMFGWNNISDLNTSLTVQYYPGLHIYVDVILTHSTYLNTQLHSNGNPQRQWPPPAWQCVTPHKTAQRMQQTAQRIEPASKLPRSQYNQASVGCAGTSRSTEASLCNRWDPKDAVQLAYWQTTQHSRKDPLVHASAGQGCSSNIRGIYSILGRWF